MEALPWILIALLFASLGAYIARWRKQQRQPTLTAIRAALALPTATTADHDDDRESKKDAVDGEPPTAIEKHSATEPADAALVPIQHASSAEKSEPGPLPPPRSHAWRREMANVGGALRAANVCAVVFVHGTFTGEDPLSVAKLLRAVPALGMRIHKPLRAWTKTGIDAVLGDLGTFSTSYAKLFGRAIGNGITCSRFNWSSENHHAARLEATLDLARTLATLADHADRKNDHAPPRLLCMAHSHGAQLFALLSHMLQETPEGSAMLDVLRARGHDLRHVRHALSSLRGVGLDVMTFGTPPRYTWAATDTMRVLHLVNKSGDLIRKLGGHGSDAPTAVVNDRALNVELAKIFGDADLAPTNVLSRIRGDAAVDTHGTTYFVDYGAISSLLAHGVYTRVFAMLFNAKLAVAHFYS